jgi:aminopeptidase
VTFADGFAAGFAALICDWCLEVAPGQQVLVETTTLAQEAAVAIHAALLDRGAWPLLRLEPPELEAGFYHHAQDLHLDGFAPLNLAEAETVDSQVRVRAPANTNALAEVDPALQARVARARLPVQQARSARRWCVSIWPTEAQAQQARMGTLEYAEFVRRALFLDQPDPIRAWRLLSERQAAIVSRLSAAREVRIESERTDLRLGVAGRQWINSDGRRNMPSGEVFTSPLERSATGRIRFDVPSTGRGADVWGVELSFRDGAVVTGRADFGNEHLQAALATDAGARFLGELGIGTNPGIDRATGSTLLDEKIAGTIHLALGRSYPETGGENQSALHWDLICDLRGGGRVTVDGEPLLQDGRLVG